MKMEKLVNVLWRLWWVALFVGVLVMCVSGVARAEIYPTTMMVVGIDEDVITAEDFSGNLWQWVEDVEDIYIGDIVAVMLDDCDTSNIYDDVIIDYNYTGWIECWAWKAGI